MVTSVPGNGLVVPLDQIAERYRAMDERRTIKALLKPWERRNGNQR